MDRRNQLQSEETDVILNAIDSIRSLGVGRVIDLPQIVVCGDQSSGKSSVLNAVSGIKFPTKDGLCTRFATEVIMRPAPQKRIQVSIQAAPGSSPARKLNLKDFHPNCDNMDNIEGLIEQATHVMGVDPKNPPSKRFSDDVLRFEVWGPDQPSLTLVDLPGLFYAPSIYQTKEDRDSVERLVLKYMDQKRSIIIAVVSAKSDIVLQKVMELCQKTDPNGLRTLGVITKPDTLAKGSDHEEQFLQRARNQQEFLHRGWHVLVNRDHTRRNSSQTKRDNYEARFLSEGVWADLTSHHKGIFSLKVRLTELLRGHIIQELPALIDDIELEISKCQERLDRLGARRNGIDDSRQYLTEAAWKFSTLMQFCVNGTYEGEFFNDENETVNSQKKLRAVLNDTLKEFSDVMTTFGHEEHIVTNDTNETNEGKSGHPKQVTQSNFELAVMKLMKREQGRELQGTHNPMIVRQLFLKQSQPWEVIAQRYENLIRQAVQISINYVLEASTDKDTKDQLTRCVIRPALEQLHLTLKGMIKQLLRPRLLSHPITYNCRLQQSIYKANKIFVDKIVVAKSKRANFLTDVTSVEQAVNFLIQQEPELQPEDLARFAAAKYIDIMRAYYKIAKETFVDNFAVLAIEDCLISQLPSLLTPKVILDLDEEEITAIAKESDEAARIRAQAESKLRSCESAAATLSNIQTAHKTVRQVSGVSELSLPGDKIIYDTDGPSGTEQSQLDAGLSDEEDVLVFAVAGNAP